MVLIVTSADYSLWVDGKTAGASHTLIRRFSARPESIGCFPLGFRFMEWGDVLVAAAIALIAAGASLTAWRLRNRTQFARLLPGALVTVLGLLVLIAVYRWGFSDASCGGRGDVVCLTNSNQGVLTVIALLLAVLAVWVEVVSRHSREHKEAEDRSVRVHQAVGHAIGESTHNLLHAALCYTNGQMLRTPWGIAIDDICALNQTEYRHDVDDRVLGHVDKIRRTFEAVQEWRGQKMNEQASGNQIALVPIVEPHPFEGFVVHHLGLLLDAWSAYKDVPACRELLRAPGLQDLQTVFEHASKRPLYLSFRTSDEDTQRDAATIRTKNGIVACWIDDQPIGVPTFSFYPRFDDAAEAHVH